MISSPIAKGAIVAIDASAALALPGVLRVFTHENVPSLASAEEYTDEIAPPGSPFRPLHDKRIRFNGQPIALVVAETLELARYAATLVRTEIDRETHATDLDRARGHAVRPAPREGITPPPKARGRASKAFTKAPVQITAEYRGPIEHHNPMEPFATTVVREADGSLTVYDKTQGVKNVLRYLTGIFGLGEGEVRVLSPFVGGAFGSGLRPQYQLFLAVLAARELKRSVRVVLTRQQMFTLGYRPATWQRVSLGARRDAQRCHSRGSRGHVPV